MTSLLKMFHYIYCKSVIQNICLEHVRLLSKFKNNFVFKENFRKAFKSIEKETPNGNHEREKLISTDVVLGNKNNRLLKSRQKKNMPSLEYFGELLFGVHPVYLALLQQKRKMYQLFINVNSKDIEAKESASRREEIIKLASHIGITVKNVDSKGLRILAPNVVHQGVCLDADPLPLCEWNETDSLLGKKDIPLCLVLHKILDPMNVGAILRSAYYFGVKKVFIMISNSCKLSPVVSKASSGALEIINVYQIESLEYFLKVMKSKKWNIVSTVAGSDTSLNMTDVSDFIFKNPTILILGNEGQGVTSNIQDLCDEFLSIYPCQNLHKGFDSLNVSVATGVILHSILKSWKEKQNEFA